MNLSHTSLKRAQEEMQGTFPLSSARNQPKHLEDFDDHILLLILEKLLESAYPEVFSRNRALAQVALLNKRFHRLTHSPWLWQTLNFDRLEWEDPCFTPKVRELCARSGKGLRTLHLPMEMIDAEAFAAFVADSPNISNLDLTFQDAKYALRFSREMVKIGQQTSGQTRLFPTNCTRLAVRSGAYRGLPDSPVDLKDFDWIWDHCTNLERLYIGWDSKASNVSRSFGLPHLTELALNIRDRMTDEFVGHLLDAAPSLHRLTVGGPRHDETVTVPGLQHILRRTSWTRLVFRQNFMCYSDFSSHPMHPILPGCLPLLAHLEIAFEPIASSGGLQNFIKYCAMPSLQELRVRCLKLDGFDEICQGHMLPKLHTLILQDVDCHDLTDLARLLRRTPSVAKFAFQGTFPDYEQDYEQDSNLLRCLAATLPRLEHLEGIIRLSENDTPDVIQDWSPLQKNLKKVSFDVTDLPQQSWPTFFSSLGSLVDLRLAGTQLRALPAGVQLPSLESLDLQFEGDFEVVMSWLRGCPKLTVFSCFCSPDAGELPLEEWQAFLDILTPIKELELYWNEYGIVPEGIHFARLTRLSLYPQSESMPHVDVLVSWMAACPALIRLNSFTEPMEMARLPPEVQRKLRLLGVRANRESGMSSPGRGSESDSDETPEGYGEHVD